MKIRHKGLRFLYERDDPRRVPVGAVPKLMRILEGLEYATDPADLESPGFRLHPLIGTRLGQWSVRVTGNLRVVFRFENNEAVGVDLVDYH